MASVLVVTITLSVILTLIFLQAALHASLTQIENKVDITVSFAVGTDEDAIANLKSSLEKLPEVAAVEYISSEQALATFRVKHAGDETTLQALDELDANPLEPSLNITARDISQYEGITKFLNNGGDTLSKDALGSVSSTDYNQEQKRLVIEKLQKIIKAADKLGLLITLLLIAISIIISFNTIRLTIYFAREEIAIMRLVGAGNRYIEGPFVIQGVVYGIIATIVTILLFVPISLWLGTHMSDFLGINVFDYYKANFLQIFAILFFSGITLGVISSLLAIRRYLSR